MSVDVKSGNVSLSVRQAKEVKTAIVSVSFKSPKGSSEAINNLHCAHTFQFSDPDVTAVLAALYLNARDRIYKGFGDESKSKIVNVSCSLQDGEFTISAMCDSSVTTVRKAVSAILDGLNPARVRAGYTNLCRTFGVSPNGDAFENACSTLESGLKSVKVFVGGKALGKSSDDKTKVQEMLDIAVKKFEPEFCGKGAARNVKANDKMPEFKETHFESKAGSVAGVTAAFLYLAGEATVQVIDCKIVAHKSMETRVSKLEDKKHLLEGQLKKVEKMDNPAHSFAFMAASYGLVGASELVKLADEKFSASGIASAAVKMF